MTPNIPFRQPENDAATLQISTAQGPAECRIFARFVLAQILREARQAGVQAEVLEESADRHGILSALVRLSGCLDRSGSLKLLPVPDSRAIGKTNIFAESFWRRSNSGHGRFGLSGCIGYNR